MKTLLLTITILLSINCFSQDNWVPANNGLPANSYVNGFAQTLNGDIYIIVNVNGLGQLLKSTDNGSSWSAVSATGLPSGGWAGSLFAKGNTMYIGTGGLGALLYSSTDNGLNWAAASNGLPANAFINDCAQTNNGDIYAIVNANGLGQLFKSTDNGSSWSAVSTTGLPSGAWAGSLFAKGNTLYIGTGGLDSLLYISTNNTTSIDDITTLNPVILFPNPSNGQTHIFATEKIDLIKVSDILGNCINEQRPNSSEALLAIEQPGNYLVTITIWGQTITKTLIVK